MTTIERLHNSGIVRSGAPKRGFKYKHSDGRKVIAEELSRIARLKVPPAWTDVAINSAPQGRVQAVGKDAAGRWQYLYHETHIRNQEKRKFRRLIDFGESLPTLRRTIARDLRRTDLSKERVMAAILRILSLSFMRPGSETYANENGSYGIATLRPRHVTVKGDQIRFEFKGKSGKAQVREVRDRQGARVLKQLLKHSNRRVFKYQDPEGRFVDITRRTINRHIKELMGRAFTAKDFRTWAGTLICACALARCNQDEELEKVSKKRKLRLAINQTAEVLGNTPAVSRDSYICPALINSFTRGEVIDSHFVDLQRLISYRGAKLHPSERSVLRLLKKQLT